MPKYKIGRDASTGRFISVTEARQRPAAAVVETIHVSGSGVRRLKRRRPERNRAGVEEEREL